MRILIADDDPVSRRLLEATLKQQGYEVEVCTDGAAAWEALQGEDPPRMAVLDWMMPGLDGVDVCRKVRERGDAEYVYILLLTSKNRLEDLVVGLEAGADDYLIKPFDVSELRMRLRSGKRVLDLLERLVDTQEQLRIQATHDPLTGTWNRRAILDMLDRELDRARRSSTNMSLIVADIDHFKSINDTYGHQVGDEILTEIVRRMQRDLRPYDALGRYGGEEFLLALPNCDRIDAIVIAERIRKACGEEVMNSAAGELRVTMSLGVATALKGVGDNATLIKIADDALYKAKAEGRNRVVTATG